MSKKPCEHCGEIGCIVEESDGVWMAVALLGCRNKTSARLKAATEELRAAKHSAAFWERNSESLKRGINKAIDLLKNT